MMHLLSAGILLGAVAQGAAQSFVNLDFEEGKGGVGSAPFESLPWNTAAPGSPARSPS